MKKKISVLLYLCTIVSFAQVGGEHVYQFLNLVSSPRQAALGGKAITAYDYDVSQPLYNPASNNVEMDNQLAVSYASHLGAINFGTAAYAYTWDRHV
ncbi:MAG: penicillin-binding protein, partial [Flavobacteriaceae bacterium]|nr:penicillin-binding protein [Flavobacteriaceae bacterium]